MLATGLWFLISRDEQPAEVALHAPIVFQHFPSQLEISSESIQEAQIRVRGPERVIRQLQANEVHAEIDLADVKSGERTFDLTSQQVRHPGDITVVQVVPSQLHLAFDTRMTREVEIHPRVTGNFADGEQIVKVDCRSATHYHHRPATSRGENRRRHDRPHRRHRHPRQRRVHHERVRLRSASAGRPGHLDSRDRPRSRKSVVPRPLH